MMAVPVKGFAEVRKINHSLSGILLAEAVVGMYPEIVSDSSSGLLASYFVYAGLIPFNIG